MSKEDNLAATETFGKAANTGQFELFNEVVAPNSVDHDPAPGQQAGPEGFRQFFTELRRAFPDLAIEVDHLVADDENVAFAYTMSGTQQGDFMGVPATGKRVSARGLQIGRFENGQLVERWGSSDELGILKQLGVDLAVPGEVT